MTNHKLDELVQKLKAAAADNLKAVILYGSAATEEFHSKHSDLNLLCLVNQADAAHLEALHGPVEWWIRRGQRPPLVFTLGELRRSADVFTIELLDMKSRHRILYGENVLAEISVPLHYHSIQVERELRTDWLRLRQAILAAPKKSNLYVELMVSSFSAFAALFRHALIALGQAPAETKREAIDRIAQFAGADPAGFQTIFKLREGKLRERDIDVENTLNQYFAFVEAVTEKFDWQLDAKK
ncbi:MAG TPA: nucleotidyltransferase domain-containing protein [Candidatus Acidoferrales bacterium]|nr:nucleotidyltransferase domain-containing protein [Candidatus Acidoferrales bacterium]